MTSQMQKDFSENRKSFYCPNGHSQHYTEDEIKKLKDTIASKDRDLEWMRAQKTRAERELSAQKGQVTKIKNRISHGVCPCCKRTFSQLARHMKMKHPDFKKEKK